MDINKELKELGFYCKRSRYNYEICKIGSSIVVNTFEFLAQVEDVIKNKKMVRKGF